MWGEAPWATTTYGATFLLNVSRRGLIGMQKNLLYDVLLEQKLAPVGNVNLTNILMYHVALTDMVNQ